MAKRIEINGKLYLPCASLAATYGYTTVYLTTLARDQKVPATKVGRQWFLDELAVAQYFVDLQKHKDNYRDEIRAERMLEFKNAQKSHFHPPPPTKAFLHSSLLFLFLVVGGYMTVISIFDVDEKSVFSLDFSQIVSAEDSGAHQSAFLGWIFDRMFRADVQVIESMSLELEVQVVQSDTIVDKRDESHSTSNSSGLIVFSPETSDEALSEIRMQFSDPVEVTFDGVDTGVITPIFKERSGESFRFLLVPLTTN